MVVPVVDDISEDYINLYDLINGCIKLTPAFLSDLHQEGLVHRNIRNSNMVKKSGPYKTSQLVDFDWSGHIGEARYPLDVNTTTVKQPAAVASGELIKAEHDKKC